MTAAASLPADAGDFEKLARLAKAHAQSVVKKIPLLGAVSWLMLQQSATRNGLLAELEARVMPALVLDQAKLYMREDMPLAYVSWALLSPEVAERYRQPPHRLAMSDWNSGDEVWVIDVFAPNGGARELMQDVQEKVHPGRSIMQLGPVESGRATVIDWSALGMR